MTPVRWEQVQAVFNEAIPLDEPEQAAFLARFCNSDIELREEVRRMIEEHRRADSILDRGLPDLAYRLVGSPLALPASRQIGAYQLIRPIGEGGMGVVYLAERTDTGKQVAMKFLPGAEMSPARRTLFTREIKTHAKLAHPCIAAQYDAGALSDGTPWFVMEYVQGQHFIDYFLTRQSTLETRLNIFRQVCHALEYLHDKGFIHSDLKSSNILIDESGTPRVLDFGIAKELQSIGEAVEGSPFELRMMTGAYAAPEWRQSGIVGKSTDVYSLGVIFHELLTGQRPLAPHGGLSKASQIPKVTQTAWRELEKIRCKALQTDSGERYRSVEAFRRDIDHFLQNEPLECVKATPWYRAERFVTRHRAAVSGGLLAALLFIGMGAFFTFRLAQERNVALAEVKHTKLVEEFLFNLFQGGDKVAGPATDLRVLTLLGRGEQEAKTLSRDPQLQAELYQVLGQINQQLGEFSNAGILLGASLKQKYAARSSPMDITESLLALGSLRLDQAKLADAARLARQALDLQRTQSPADSLAIARAQSLLGRVLVEQQRYGDGIVLLRQAEQIQSKREEAQADLAITLTGLSDAYFNLSRYPLAEFWTRQALALHEKLHGWNHPLVAIDLRNLGNIQIQTTHYVQAEKYLRDALNIDQNWYGEHHPETAVRQIELAQALEWQGHLAEAESLLQEALVGMQQSYGQIHPRVALAFNELEGLAFRQQRWDAAEQYARQAVDIYARTLGAKNQYTVVAQNNLASIYLKLKQYTRAEKIFSQSIAVLTEQNLSGTLNAGITRIKLGRSLTRQGRFREAAVQLRRGCAIVREKAGPNAEWILAVRPDFVAICRALGRSG